MTDTQAPTLPDAHPVVPWLTPARRAWLYRLAAAFVGLLLVAGLVGPDALDAWLELIAAALGLTTTTVAALHTPRGGQ